MKKIIILCICFFMTGCTVNNKPNIEPESNIEDEIKDENKCDEDKELTPEEIKEQIILNKISEMSIEEKVGQLFMVEFRQDENGDITSINEDITEKIQKYHLGGVILFGENIKDTNQVKDFINDIKNSSPSPLFIGIDEEGGQVSRLKNCEDLTDYNIPTAAEMAEEGLDAVYKYNNIIGEKLYELGFNVDFAPVADINTNPNNPVIGSRAFGSDSIEAGKCVEKAIEALNDNNISSGIKHFPGHGDTKTDSHYGEAKIEHDLDRLKSTELVPFEMGINSGAEFVMVGHIKTPNITDNDMPASLSKEIISDLLRQYMGFNGIVITDALNMGAISEYYSQEQVAMDFINAGGDIMLMPLDLDKYYNTILNAVKNGEIDEERINNSVERILSVKYDKYMSTGYGSQWFNE